MTIISLVSNNLVRVTIGATDIVMGILTLVMPEWSLEEYSGMSFRTDSVGGVMGLAIVQIILGCLQILGLSELITFFIGSPELR